MRDSGALTELLLTRLKKVEVPKNYVSLRKRSQRLIELGLSAKKTGAKVKT